MLSLLYLVFIRRLANCIIIYKLMLAVTINRFEIGYGKKQCQTKCKLADIICGFYLICELILLQWSDY